MTLASKLERFRPLRLIRALEVARAAHPNTSDSPENLPSSLLERVRQRLVETEDEHLPVLTQEFSPQEVLASLQLLSRNEESIVHERGERIVRLRNRRDSGKHAWRLLVSHYPVKRLESLLRFLAQNHGWRSFVKEDVTAQRLEVWFSHAELAEGILEDFITAHDRALSDWLETHALPETSALHTGVWRYLLTRGSGALLRRFDHMELLERAKREPMPIQDAFARNYLIALAERSRWNVRVLQWIRHRKGVPQIGETQTSFWQRVPPAIRDAFRRWVNETKIREFFDRIQDPHGRFRFWQQYLDFIQDVSDPIQDEALLMDFRSFGVAEFSHIGHAAYIYTGPAFARIFHAPHRSLRDLKDRNAVHLRIIHRQGWEDRSRVDLQRLLGTRRRA